MSQQQATVNSISWRDLCPWLLIFRALPVACSLNVVLLGFVGTVVTPLGWLGAGVLITESMRTGGQVTSSELDFHRVPYQAIYPRGGADLAVPWQEQVHSLEAVFARMVRPTGQLFSYDNGARKFFYYLIGAAWTIAVWSFIGLAVTRIAALRLTRDERINIDDAIRFAVEKWRSAFFTIVLPLLGVVVICVPLAIAGVLMSFGAGTAIVGLFWIFVLMLGFGMAVLLVGLAAGWPLMISAIGVEGQDSFDALSRGYAYCFQRPVNYVFYVLVALLLGALVWWLVFLVTSGVIGLSYWATSWGATLFGSERFSEIVADPPWLINFWNSVAWTFAASFVYGLFWCVAVAIYLLLRKDLDDTEMDEVYLVDDRRTFELPDVSAPQAPGEIGDGRSSQPAAENPTVPEPGTDE